MLTLTHAVVRPLRESELSLANHWAADEGWNPGPADAGLFNTVDPGSLLTLEIDGAPVGVISSARLAPGHGFIGFFVLAPEHRRARHGWTLMNAGRERLDDHVIGSEVIPALVRTYAHYGMRPCYHTVSYHGFAPSAPPPWRRGVEPAAETPVEELEHYDAETVGLDRGKFLRAWLNLPETRAVVYRRAGRLRGFGVARRCLRGVRIGPLQADDAQAANAIFDALSGLAPGEELSIDCPDINPRSAPLAAAKGLVPGSTTARLYRGTPPNGQLRRAYGLMSFALG